MEISTDYFSRVMTPWKIPVTKPGFGNKQTKDTFELSFKGSVNKTAANSKTSQPKKKESEIIAAQIEIKKRQYAKVGEEMHSMTRKQSGCEARPLPEHSFLELVVKANAIQKEIIDLEAKYTQVRNIEIKEDSLILSYDDFRAKILGKAYRKSAAEKRIPDEMIDRWAQNGHIKREQAGKNQPYYINSENEINREAINILQKKLPYASNTEQFKFRYNINDDKIRSFIKQDKISLLLDRKDEIKPSSYFLIDETSEITRNTLKERNKLVPFPSKFYKFQDRTKEMWVPVNILTKLGYGDKKTLFDGINRAKLCARKIMKETPLGLKSAICIDIADEKTESELKQMKEANKNIKSPRELAKQLNLTNAEVEEALLNEDLSIIKRYVYECDASKIFIDTSDEKNSEFIDKKTIENEFFGALRMPQKHERSASAARMKIILHYSPETMKAASEEAENFPDLKTIIEKHEENPYNKLNNNEKTTAQKYAKAVWDKAGTEEFHSAIKKADETMRIYKEFGIDAIKDEEIRNILSKIR